LEVTEGVTPHRTRDRAATANMIEWRHSVVG
jgi:hypothetical protein